MVLLVLTQLVSPLTPHLAEEVFFRMPKTLREALAAHRSSKIMAALGPQGEGLADALGLCGPLTSVFHVCYLPFLMRLLWPTGSHWRAFQCTRFSSLLLGILFCALSSYMYP